MGAVRFSRERHSREETNSWQRMRLGFENGIESPAFFATGLARGGSFVAGGFFLCRESGRSKKEFQAAGGQCGAHSQTSCPAGPGGHRFFGGRREGREDSGNKGRVYPERSFQSDAQRLAVRRREASKVGNLPCREAGNASWEESMSLSKFAQGRAASPRPQQSLSEYLTSSDGRQGCGLADAALPVGR